LIEDGRRQLRAGNWPAAQDCFRAALELGESAEALDGLAMAAYWLNDLEEAIHLKQRAHVAYKREHKPGPAAFTAATPSSFAIRGTRSGVGERLPRSSDGSAIGSSRTISRMDDRRRLGGNAWPA
jgi:hypothetical protein